MSYSYCRLTKSLSFWISLAGFWLVPRTFESKSSWTILVCTSLGDMVFERNENITRLASNKIQEILTIRK